MKTGLVAAVVDEHLTVGAVVARATVARVAALAHVQTRAPVLAGRMVRAEVQICQTHTHTHTHRHTHRHTHTHTHTVSCWNSSG